MDLVQSFLIANLIYIYFVYGLAFFVLGFAISLAPKPQLPSLATSLRFLGAFGIAHGFAEWTHVFDLAGFPTPGFIHIALLLVAGVCLVQFAARMLIVLEPHRQWVRQLPPSFIIAWLLVITFVDLFAGRMDALADAEMLVHYLLFFPGSALAAWAFFKQAQRIAPRPESLSRDMRLAIAFFVLHALTCGIFMPLEYLPTVAIINPMGLAITDMALLVIRTALAVGATFLFLSLLHTFETQRVNELEVAQHERLEAQEQARQAAEQRSRDLAKEKDRAESLYNSVLENANDAIFIHDLEGRFLDVNRTACERLGYTRAELLRLSVKQLDDPETAAHFDEAMKENAKKGSVVGETRHVHKDGRCIPTEISAQLIEYKGQPAVLSVARDISERKRIETETQQRNHELDALYKEAEQRAERIAVSNEIIRTVSSSQSLHDVFLTFSEQTRRLVPYSRMGIALVNETADAIVFVGRYLEDGLDSQQGITYPIADTPLTEVIHTKRPWLRSDVNQERDYAQLKETLLELGLQSSIMMPILWKDQVLGVLNLHSQTPNGYSEKDVQLLEPIAGQLAITIKNSQLQKQIQDLAIQSERDRLGRELHDGLGQVLGYIRIKIGEVIELLRVEDTGEARRVLAELNENAQIAYADVREAILGLRSTVTAGTGIESVLREYLHRYQREWSIHTEFVMQGDNVCGVAPSAEIQLLRIIQEALTNVRKHARAKNAWVHFARDTNRLLVTIADDGCGFDVDQPHCEHFGLQTMAERAESVGGYVEINSKPNAGTCVRVMLPCNLS